MHVELQKGCAIQILDGIVQRWKAYVATNHCCFGLCLSKFGGLLCAREKMHECGASAEDKPVTSKGLSRTIRFREVDDAVSRAWLSKLRQHMRAESFGVVELGGDIWLKLRRRRRWHVLGVLTSVGGCRISTSRILERVWSEGRL